VLPGIHPAGETLAGRTAARAARLLCDNLAASITLGSSVVQANRAGDEARSAGARRGRPKRRGGGGMERDPPGRGAVGGARVNFTPGRPFACAPGVRHSKGCRLCRLWRRVPPQKEFAPTRETRVSARKSTLVCLEVSAASRDCSRGSSPERAAECSSEAISSSPFFRGFFSQPVSQRLFSS